MSSPSRLLAGFAALGVSMCLSMTLACSDKGSVNADPAPVQAAYSTSLYARVMSGKGSGVVGAPLENVEVMLKVGDQSLGPVYTDPTGTLEVDAASLWPEGTALDDGALASIEPLHVELHFDKAEYRPSVEIVTFPVDKYKDYVFYLKGEGE